MAQFEPYLCFNGNCADAMRFYERTLGGKIEMMMKFSEAPPQPGQPPMQGDGIMLASMTLEGNRLMASDTPPGMPYEPMKGMTVSLAYKTAQEGRKIFDALAFAFDNQEVIERDLLREEQLLTQDPALTQGQMDLPFVPESKPIRAANRR